MHTILLYAVIFSSVAVTALILMQQSDAGMGDLFGDSSDTSVARTRRGPELVIFNTTIYATAFFAAVSLAAFLIR